MKHTLYSVSFFLLIGLLSHSCSKRVLNEQITVEPSAIELAPPNIVWITSEDNSKHYMKLFDAKGVETPHIKALADQGIKFTRAFSNAPVCSVARSTLISGCYAPRVGVQFHRKIEKVNLPDGVEMYPAYLRKAGYYTSNNSKEDYNFNKPDDVWDDSSKTATWRSRAAGQSFFHISNIGTTHESRLHFTQEDMENYQMKNEVSKTDIFPFHPNTNLFQFTNGYYRDKIQQMDQQLGDIVSELTQDGLMDETFIFYFGDHGGVLPGSKGYIYETGLHVPLVVYVPKKYQHLVSQSTGTENNGFVSFIDFGATVLNLAGVSKPAGIDGSPFIGPNVSMKEVAGRDEVFCYADRFDEKYDLTRSYRKGNYKYIRNYSPFNFDGLMNNYRYKQLAYAEWWQLYKENKLNDVQSQFFKARDAEQLFDLESDPYETKNLASDPEYRTIRNQMRTLLTNKLKALPDLSFYPEHHLIGHAFDNPVEFGKSHKRDISDYIDICNLALVESKGGLELIKKYLNSEDSWKRYWALTTLGHFKSSDVNMALLEEIAEKDSQLINRVRAAEYLALNKSVNPTSYVTKALYQSKKPAEALSILGSIVLLQDGDSSYPFDLDINQMYSSVAENSEVKRRLLYLGMIKQ